MLHTGIFLVTQVCLVGSTAANEAVFVIEMVNRHEDQRRGTRHQEDQSTRPSVVFKKSPFSFVTGRG